MREGHDKYTALSTGVFIPSGIASGSDMMYEI